MEAASIEDWGINKPHQATNILRTGVSTNQTLLREPDFVGFAAAIGKFSLSKPRVIDF